MRACSAWAETHSTTRQGRRSMDMHIQHSREGERCMEWVRGADLDIAISSPLGLLIELAFVPDNAQRLVLIHSPRPETSRHGLLAFTVAQCVHGYCAPIARWYLYESGLPQPEKVSDPISSCWVQGLASRGDAVRGDLCVALANRPGVQMWRWGNLSASLRALTTRTLGQASLNATLGGSERKQKRSP